MSIFEVRHQPRAHRLVQRALESGRLPHAYLFHGPDGVGKEMMAERLARILLCERPVRLERPTVEELAGFDGPLRDACGRCRDCVLTCAGTHPDLHVVHRHLHVHHPEARVRNLKGLELPVDVIRYFVIDAAGTKPAQGRAKVFIIREADRITDGAQNALLKTLEEPPAKTFLILVASGLDKLLATTKSRCQPVPFVALPSEFVAARLTELVEGLAPERAAAYAALAQGSLGAALQYCRDDLESYHARVANSLGELGAKSATQIAKQWLEEGKALAARFLEREKQISETEAQRRGLKALFALVAASFTAVLHGAVEGDGPVTAPAPAGLLASSRFGAEQAAQAIRAVVDAERHLDRNAAVQLAVETLVIRLSRLVAPP